MRWIIDYDNKTTGSSGFEIINTAANCKAQDIADYFLDWYEQAGEDIEIRGIFKEVKKRK